ncbi:carbohydrate porin, partial [Phocaeicola sp.]|uniref:carbohydrate porin n=1 Tax=Phocaeicola sp. TaxID=2773926 RepID=UPI003A8D95D4
MTKFLTLFLSLTTGASHCCQAQELQVNYTTELQSDFKQGSNWVNLLRLNFTHSLGKHTTLQAATISTARTRSESLADDFQTFSNIEEENHPLDLATLGVQQQFGHSSLFFGIRNLNEDYFTSPVTSLFTNSSCGIFPTLSADYQIANYPIASVGLHYELQFTRWSLQASVYNGKGYYRFAGKENVFRFCPQSDGILSITSLNYQHHGSNYHVGFALHSSMHMDYEEGTLPK